MQIKYIRILIFSMAFLCGLSAVRTQAQPIPAQHPTAALEEKKKEEEKKKAALQRKAEEINSQMEETQQSLVNLADKVAKNEAELNELDSKIEKGRQEQSDIEKRLKRDKASIGSLVLALERLNRTPPEAIIARPGAPMDTAQSAMLLQSILPDIYERAGRLKRDLARLQVLVTELETDQAKAREKGEELAAKQKEMQGLLDKRKSLYADTQKNIQISDASLKDIAAEAKSLKDLVEQLERKRREAEERTRALADEQERTRTNRKRDIPSEDIENDMRRYAVIPTPLPRAGSGQLPIQGVIRLGFDQTDEIGAPSQGLKIEGRSGGMVVAPMGGIVRYAGFFKNYGKIVIVEHQKDYHSLIAGLSKIDTVVGQAVRAGEPIGTLPKQGNDGGKPVMYYELRLNGEPVNPSRKIAGL